MNKQKLSITNTIIVYFIEELGFKYQYEYTHKSSTHLMCLEFENMNDEELIVFHYGGSQTIISYNGVRRHVSEISKKAFRRILN